MLFCPQNKDDIHRYYRGTYIKLKEFGDQLFYIETVDGGRVLGKHESGEAFCIFLDNDTPYEVEYILPHKSFFQYGEYAVQLQRVPAKQYFRGLHSSNTTMSYLSPSGQKAMQLTFDTLKGFVNKKAFASLKQAIGGTDYTTALSPRMMYRKGTRELFVDFTIVARVHPSKMLVSVTKPVFMDEVKELIVNTAPEFKVELYVPPPPKEKTTTEDLVREMGQKKKIDKIKAMYNGNPFPQPIQPLDQEI